MQKTKTPPKLPHEVTTADQLKEAKRELALRKSVYPKWIFANKISREQADWQIAIMETIVNTLEKLMMLEQVSDDIKNETIQFPSLQKNEQDQQHESKPSPEH